MAFNQHFPTLLSLPRKKQFSRFLILILRGEFEIIKHRGKKLSRSKRGKVLRCRQKFAPIRSVIGHFSTFCQQSISTQTLVSSSFSE